MATRTYQQTLGSATAVTNSSSSTYVNQCSATFSLDASATYLVLGYMEGQVNNTTATDGQYRLFDGTTALCSANFRHVSSDASEWTPINLCALITTTGAVTPTLSLQAKLASTGSSRIVSTRNGVIFAIKLGANDASFTNDVSGTSTANPGSWTDYNPASGTKVLTFTPGSSGDYLIFAFCTQTYSAATDGSILTLLCEDGSTQVMTSYWVPNNSGNKQSYCGVAKRASLAASSQSFKLQHSRQRSASGTSTLDQVRMVALRLDDFNGDTHTEDTSSATTTSASYVDMGSTRTDTLTNAIDYLLLASWWEGTNNNSILHSSRLTDGTNVYNESQRKELYHAGEPNWGQMICVPHVVTGAGSSVTHKVQGKITSVLTETMTEHRLHVLQLMTSGITPTPISASDSATLTDTSGGAIDTRPAAVETATLTDVSTALDRPSSDAAVMSDVGGAVELAPVAVETATLTDVTTALAAAGSITDAATVTDATTVFDRAGSNDPFTLTEAEALDRPSSDSAALTDVTSGLGAAGSIFDTATLTDLSTALDRPSADAATLTDVTTALAADGTIFDTATLTDGTPAGTAAVATTDNGTLADASSVAVSGGSTSNVNVSASDAATLTDTTTGLAADVATVDPATLADATTALPAALATTDSATLTDATPALTAPFASSDAAALADASTAAPAVSASDAVSCVETSGVGVAAGTTDGAVLVDLAAVSAVFGATDAAFLAEIDVLAAALGRNDAASLTDTSAPPVAELALVGWPTGRTWGATLATAGTGAVADRDAGTGAVAGSGGSGAVAGSGGGGAAADRGGGTSGVGLPT